MDKRHSTPLNPSDSPQQARQYWMAVLAKAPWQSIEQALSQVLTQCPGLPSYHYLRQPETGLTMVRGRTGGTGQPFNLGEITLTRSVVQLGDTVNDAVISGFGYVAGRSHRHAELAAICDALLQHPSWHDKIYSTVIAPLEQAAKADRNHRARQVEATRVNFFTMQRGE
ncbi:MAG: phosphonate C-P lyase system protein PhnG [Cyanobacteria bacterium P01_D01_bin.44]